MADERLHSALRVIVEQYGYSSVNIALNEIKDSESRTRTACRKESAKKLSDDMQSNSKKRNLDAIEYVLKMNLPPDRKSVLVRAAERFQRRAFLPTIGDIRHFWSVYRVETQIPSSRAGAIPRVFNFMSNMDPKEVARILETKAFSGPARLGPIAEAIKNRSRERLRDSRVSMQDLPDCDTPSEE